MTAQEKHVLAKVLKQLENPSVDTAYYDENMKRTEAPELVPGTPNHKLLDDEMFKAGYKRCHEQFSQMLLFLLSATTKDMIRYAGRPKKEKK